MTKLNNNKLALDAHLDELMHILNLNDYASKLKLMLNQVLNWNAMSVEQKTLINNFFKSKENPNRTLCNSLYISAVASFESFLVKTIDSTILLLNDKFRKYESYTATFINRQIDFSGKILSSIYSPPNHVNVDFYKICKNIGTIYPGSNDLTLNPEISTYIRNILDLENFSKFFYDLEIIIDANKMSDSQKIREAFGATGKKEAAKLLDNFIREIVKMRNRIAHTGQSASDLDPERIKDLIFKLRAISDSINEILIQDLGALCN